MYSDRRGNGQKPPRTKPPVKKPTTNPSVMIYVIPYRVKFALFVGERL